MASLSWFQFNYNKTSLSNLLHYFDANSLLECEKNNTCTLITSPKGGAMITLNKVNNHPGGWGLNFVCKAINYVNREYPIRAINWESSLYTGETITISTLINLTNGITYNMHNSFKCRDVFGNSIGNIPPNKTEEIKIISCGSPGSVYYDDIGHIETIIKNSNGTDIGRHV